MSRPALPAAELRRFAGSPRALLALFALVLVPLVYGGLYTWANESPTTRVDQIAAAVVNLDEPVTLKGADGKKAEAWLTLGEVVAVHIDKAFIKDGVYQTGLAHPIVRAGRRGDYFEIKPENMFEMIRPD